MLVLTRNCGEYLVVGDDVTVSVISVRGKEVKLGINAPKNVSVHRSEIYEKIKIEGEKRNAERD